MQSIVEVAEYMILEIERVDPLTKAMMVSMLETSVMQKLRIGQDFMKLLDREITALRKLTGELAVARPAAVLELPRERKGDRKTHDALRRNAIFSALQKCGGVRSAAARSLGMQKNTFYYHLTKYRAQGYDIPASPVEHPKGWDYGTREGASDA